MLVSPFKLREATPADAAWFAPRLRPSDQAEVAAFFEDPVQGILLSIVASQITAVAVRGDDDRPVILLGCAQDGDNPAMAAPWLLATDEVARYPGALTRIGRHYVDLFSERWPLLLNYVDERNTVSARWLERLGFTLGDAVCMGRNGENFRPFTMGA